MEGTDGVPCFFLNGALQFYEVFSYSCPWFYWSDAFAFNISFWTCDDFRRRLKNSLQFGLQQTPLPRFCPLPPGSSSASFFLFFFLPLSDFQNINHVHLYINCWINGQWEKKKRPKILNCCWFSVLGIEPRTLNVTCMHTLPTQLHRAPNS